MNVWDRSCKPRSTKLEIRRMVATVYFLENGSKICPVAEIAKFFYFSKGKL